MARKNSGARRSGSDMFDNGHGTNGKGDADRTTDRAAYSRNIAEVSFTGSVKMDYVGGGRYRKSYEW